MKAVWWSCSMTVKVLLYCSLPVHTIGSAHQHWTLCLCLSQVKTGKQNHWRHSCVFPSLAAPCEIIQSRWQVNQIITETLLLHKHHTSIGRVTTKYTASTQNAHGSSKQPNTLRNVAHVTHSCEVGRVSHQTFYLIKKTNESKTNFRYFTARNIRRIRNRTVCRKMIIHRHDSTLSIRDKKRPHLETFNVSLKNKIRIRRSHRV